MASLGPPTRVGPPLSEAKTKRVSDHIPVALRAEVTFPMASSRADAIPLYNCRLGRWSSYGKAVAPC